MFSTPFYGMAWDSAQPGRHKAAISCLSSPSHCCCGGFMPNTRTLKTFVSHYKNRCLTAAHGVSSVVNLSLVRYCLHMATRSLQPSIPTWCSGSQRFPNSWINWKQHSEFIYFNRSLSNPHPKDTNQILSFF